MTASDQDPQPWFGDKAGSARSGTSARSPLTVGVTAAHALVAALGVALLVWTASPLVYDGWVGSSGRGSWVLLAISAVLCGGIGGMLEGIALATGHRFLASMALVIVSVPAMWMPFLVVGRWFSDQDYAFGTSTLFEPVVGWLMFVAVISVTAVSVAAIWVAASHRRPVPADDRMED